MTTTELARAYLSAPHQPGHPSYKAFAAETREQFETLIEKGLKLNFIPGTVTASSRNLFKRLDQDFTLEVATDGSPLEPGHPLAEVDPKTGLDLNTMFRVVHDVNGHYLARAPFETFDGELGAYRSHRRMYSPLARPALFTETVLQLCHFYAFGEFVPTQKCVIL